MARRDVTPELYNVLLAAFRERPGNFAYAAAASVGALGPDRGCERRMAKTGWEQGWAKRHPWARCIRVVLEEEQTAARAKQLAEETAARRLADVERVRAREQAIGVTQQEATAVKLARGNVIAVLGSVGLLAKGLRASAEKLATQLEKGEVSAKDLGFLFKNIAAAVSSSGIALERVIKLEREVVGDPKKLAEELAGVAEALEESGDFDPKKAADEIRRANDALERAHRIGLIALPGGKDASPPDPAKAAG
jgi:hypothetical protein